MILLSISPLHPSILNFNISAIEQESVLLTAESLHL